MGIRTILGAGLALAASSFALTMDGAVQQARRQNPATAPLRAEVEAARRELAFAGRPPNPELSIAPGGVRSGAGWSWKSRVGLSQTIEYPGKRAARRDAARGDLRERTLELEMFHLQLDFQVREAFLEALRARDELSSWEERRRMADDFLSLALRRREAMATGDLDGFRAQADRDEAAAAEESASQELRASKSRLAGLLGTPLDTSFALEGRIEADTGTRLSGDPVETAPRSGPRARLLELRIENARSAAEAARLAGRPDITIGPEVELSPGETSVSLGIGLPLPVWNRGEAERTSARIRLQRVESELEVARLDVVASVRQAQVGVQAARRKLELRSPLRLEELSRLLERTESAYARGATGIASVLDARGVLFQAQAARRAALFELAIAQARLEAAVGESSNPSSSEIGGN